MSQKVLEINGYKLEIGAIAPLAPISIENRYKAEHPEPTPPTYSVDSVAGKSIELEYDDASIQDGTEEEKLAYLKYKEDKERWQQNLTMKLMRLFLLQGVKLNLSKSDEEELIVQARLLGIDNVPNNKEEKKLFFLETFILTSGNDIETVMQAVLESTGIKKESLAAANDLF